MNLPASPLTISRLEKRKIEFRGKITRAALKLFSEKGVSATSIASIIKEADIAHKTFFNHFPTKDHLLQHIVSSHSDHAYHFFREAVKQHRDPRKQLEYCLIKIAEALEPLDPQLYKELVTFYFVSNASTKDFREQQKINFTSLIKTILKNAKKENLLRTGFTLDALTDIVVDLSVAILLKWSVEEDFLIVPKMKKTIKFINVSIFSES